VREGGKEEERNGERWSGRGREENNGRWRGRNSEGEEQGDIRGRKEGVKKGGRKRERGQEEKMGKRWQAGGAKSYLFCKLLVGSTRVLLLLLTDSFPSPSKTLAVLWNPSEAGIVAARARARMSRRLIEARAATMLEKGETCRDVQQTATTNTQQSTWQPGNFFLVCGPRA